MRQEAGMAIGQVGCPVEGLAGSPWPAAFKEPLYMASAVQNGDDRWQSL